MDAEQLGELEGAVRDAVRAGYADEDDIVRDVMEMFELDDDAQPRLEAVLRSELAALEAEEQGWTVPTANDRLTAAFGALNAAGIVALECAGYTMSDGWEDVSEAASDLKPPARGAAFFHGQDVERGVAGQGLMVAFGAFDQGPRHEALSLELGAEICRTLREHGVPCEWSGSLQQRITIAPFRWQRRRFTTR